VLTLGFFRTYVANATRFQVDEIDILLIASKECAFSVLFMVSVVDESKWILAEDDARLVAIREEAAFEGQKAAFETAPVQTY